MANLAEIIAAAAKMFQTTGYHAATVQDIADAVGILKGSLYHHVKSKEDLLYLIVLTSKRSIDTTLTCSSTSMSARK
jgi:AcrR family transcriptional regulator